MKVTGQDLQGLFLFQDFSPSEYTKIIESFSPQISEYEKGELVLSKEQNCHTVGFVLSGECEVRRKRQDGKYVLLNTLKPKSSFGILSVFSESEAYPTEIFARKSAAVLFFTKENIFKMCEELPSVSVNIMRFLADRVIFLNKKIAAFSGGSVEEKLAVFLYNEYEKLGAQFPLNCKRCSEALGVGRASVYRALDSLQAEGIITFVDKKINIICPDGLERNTK